ncbi:MAG TPA: hypothetical protein VGF24_37240 [Vicinamibacterales bacterium]|jgi:hypothetical protein
MHPWAEALGVDTDCIMSAASLTDQMWGVLFTETPTADPDEWVWLAVLQEDQRGILHVVRREKHKRIGEMNDALALHMESIGKRGFWTKERRLPRWNLRLPRWLQEILAGVGEGLEHHSKHGKH